MKINKITLFIDYNHWLIEKFGHFKFGTKVTIFFEPTNKIKAIKTLGTSVIYSPMSPSSLLKNKTNIYTNRQTDKLAIYLQFGQ